MLVANIAIAQDFKQGCEKPLLTAENRNVLVSIKGKIEIDGYVFENKTIKFEANLDGIKIYDSEKEYTHIDCKKPKCEIIHLESKNYTTIKFNPGWVTTTNQNIKLLTN